jgi:hypothetical protein
MMADELQLIAATVCVVASDGRTSMSKTTIQNLIALCDAEERNFDRVKERLGAMGRKDVNPAVIASVAKYYEALNRLSSE